MDQLLAWLSHYGYAGLFALLVLGIVGLPIPDETLLVFSGYLIYKGRLHPAPAFLAAFLGSTIGISLSYVIGRTLGYGFVHRYGRYIRLTPKKIEAVHDWFHKFGDWLLTFGYFVPGVRHLTALVAGLSSLEYRTFALFAYPGAAIWVGAFLSLGYFLGERWRAVQASVDQYLLLATIVALIGLAIWWILKKRRTPSRR